MGYYIFARGFCVVLSTNPGNAKASNCGMGNQYRPCAFYIYLIRQCGGPAAIEDMSLRDFFTRKTDLAGPYDSLTWNQKKAAISLMVVFGGSCSGTSTEIEKINHIISVEGSTLGIPGHKVEDIFSQFSDMPEIVNSLIGANRFALENLFWACYRIIAVGKSAQAVHLLLAIYQQLGFSEQECAYILEKRTGASFCDL